LLVQRASFIASATDDFGEGFAFERETKGEGHAAAWLPVERAQ
jgi:hypothetical protein